jgi:hypothetical protein
MIDVHHEITAVRREVGDRVVDAGQARTVTIARSYDAPVEDVRDACTNPERIPRWFLPVTGELREGGRFQLEGNAGGTIERCEPPAGASAGSSYACRPEAPVGRGSRCSTSRSSRTKATGSSSAPALSASAGISG